MALPAWLSSTLLSVLQLLFTAFSGPIKEALKGFVRDLYAKSLATDNPFDDFGVMVLAFILGINLDNVAPAPAEPGVVPKTMNPQMAGLLLKGAERKVYEKVYSNVIDDGGLPDDHPIYDA